MNVGNSTANRWLIEKYDGTQNTSDSFKRYKSKQEKH